MRAAAPERDVRDWRPLLRAVPQRNVAARVDRSSTDETVVRVPTQRPWYLAVPPLSWMVPVRPERTVRLDRLGAEVWGMCDGTCTVESVVERFAGSHGLTFHEARVSVTGYLSALVQRGVLAMVLREGQTE